MGLDSDYVLYLCGNTIRFRTWKVNFIDYRKYIQVVVEGKVYIGQRLGLNSLCGVYNKNRSVAGCEAPRYLVVEIDMAWGIDEVEDIDVYKRQVWGYCLLALLVSTLNVKFLSGYVSSINFRTCSFKSSYPLSSICTIGQMPAIPNTH